MVMRAQTIQLSTNYTIYMQAEKGYTTLKQVKSLFATKQSYFEEKKLLNKSIQQTWGHGFTPTCKPLPL